MCGEDEASWREQTLAQHQGHQLRYFETIDQARTASVVASLVVDLGDVDELQVCESTLTCVDCDEELIHDKHGPLIQFRIEP